MRRRRYAAAVFIILGYSSRFVSLFSPDHSRPNVSAEAAELDKALEIDWYPDRQDLNVGLLSGVPEHGARISIGTDAHHPWQLEFIELGLAAALKAKISPHQIINFMSISALRNWVKQTRQCS
jgi:histidinol phosphatase-like PHP family hydrolase